MSKKEDSFDVIVIGAGPAGYVAAIRCAQLGLNTACIDNWIGKNGKHSLGGTYLNVGNIPSLILMESAKYYQLLRGEIQHHGITVSGVQLDLATTIRHKDDISKKISEQIAGLFNTNKITCLFGRARLLDGKRVEVNPLSGSKNATILKAETVILAAGSCSADMSVAKIDGESIVDSTAAMNFESVPKRLGIIGAGVIGLEHAAVWSRLGAKVTLLEAQNEFLTFADHQIAAQALEQYTAQGLDIRLGARVTAAKKTAKQVTVQYTDNDGQHRLVLDKLIVAVGRKPNTEDLFVAEANLLLDEQGFVHVDEQCMTNLPGVYAIGDLVGAPMLVHKGCAQGIYVAEIITGKERPLNYDTIPSVIYTDPEIAWVGHTEQALKATGEELNVGIFPFSANDYAQAIGRPHGMVKILANKQTDRIQGVHIIGQCASEQIAEAVLAMEFSASTEDLARTIHAHPSLTKSIYEAALAVDKRALHLPPVVK